MVISANPVFVFFPFLCSSVLYFMVCVSVEALIVMVVVVNALTGFGWLMSYVKIVFLFVSSLLVPIFLQCRFFFS